MNLRNVDVKVFYVKSEDRKAHLKKLEKHPIQFSEFKFRRKDGTAIWGRDYPRTVKGKGVRSLSTTGSWSTSARRRKARTVSARR